MKRVIIESPYAGDVQDHTWYAQECLRDSLGRGEAPFASHLLYTQVLDDNDPEQRELGISAGLAWGERAALTAVYCDRGISHGMARGISAAIEAGRPISWRWIDSARELTTQPASGYVLAAGGAS